MLAIAEALGGIQNAEFKIQNEDDACRFAFFGSSRAIDRELIRIPDADLVQQSVRPVSLRPWKWPAFYWHWRASRKTCREYFSRQRPAVVIGSGGFASGPPICEAAALGIPTVLLNPDAVPGRANRFLAGRADLVCVQWAESRARFAGHPACVVTGCPVRGRFRSAGRTAGLEHFGLSADRRTLLVTGASQGATSINGAIIALLDDLSRLSDWQFLHLAGTADAERTRAAYAARGLPANVLAFTDRMPEAMAAADLIVSRAGASTLAEITAMGKPSVLMPYPYHRDMHQRTNARMLTSRGAACLVEDRIDPRLTAPALREALLGLMGDEGALARMASAARRMGAPDAAERIAAEVRRLANKAVKNGR